MKTIIKQELKNYLKNPILWAGLLFILVELVQILSPYLKLHYFESEEELSKLSAENMGDADIMDGYIPSTEKEMRKLAFDRTKEELVREMGLSGEEAEAMLSELRKKELPMDQLSEELSEKLGFTTYSLEYYYQEEAMRKASLEEANDYIADRLSSHSFSYYFARKYADFCGLFLGFFSAILLAFLFIRDTRRDIYELLHTKPVSAAGYVLGKTGGGFLVMTGVWAVFTAFFGIWCEVSGRRAGFPVNFWDFLVPAVIYILPNLLMITAIYAVTALIFKNPLPAIPALFLYLIYSNMGSNGPNGFDYYGRPLAIMVRFPGSFFEVRTPSMVELNQGFLLIMSALLTVLSVRIWKRRRVY